MGVRMGMADIDERPMDKFGMEPIPRRRQHTGEHDGLKER